MWCTHTALSGSICRTFGIELVVKSCRNSLQIRLNLAANSLNSRNCSDWSRLVGIGEGILLVAMENLLEMEKKTLLVGTRKEFSLG